MTFFDTHGEFSCVHGRTFFLLLNVIVLIIQSPRFEFVINKKYLLTDNLEPVYASQCCKLWISDVMPTPAISFTLDSSNYIADWYTLNTEHSLTQSVSAHGQ